MPMQRNKRPAAILVIVAISLAVLLGIIALTVDGGMLLAEKRMVQAAADASAMAAAVDLYKNYGKNAGEDKDGTAKASALVIATGNGYNNDGTTSKVEVRLFDGLGQTYLGGPNAGTVILKSYVEVTITSYHPRFFSNIFGTGDVAVVARAVATGSWRIPEWGILVLDPIARSSFTITGNGTVDVQTGVVQVNSTDASAMVNTNNGTIEANALNITGNYTGGGTYITEPVPNNINTGMPPVEDPLALLPPPPVPPPAPKPTTLDATSDIVLQLVSAGKLTTDMVTNFTTGGGKITYLEPGLYDKSIQLSFTSKDLVIFKQGGIYYLETGLDAQSASLLMDPTTTGGMMFYNAGTGENDKIKITGNPGGIVELYPLESGPYAGFLIYQNRLATQDVVITGNGTFNMFGSFYAANGTLNLTGNGESQTIGSQLIARFVTLSGNGNINITYSSGKIAPTRVLHLVE